MSRVTFCLTSCNRFDLLEKTLNSFIKFNTYDIDKFFIIDDSTSVLCHGNIQNAFPFVELITNDTPMGQIKSIDKLYERVETEFIFHCEDDWEFLKPGFIEKSIKVLESDKDILQVWIREISDHQHPLLEQEYSVDEIKYKQLMPMWQNIYSGFTFNPSLRRLSDYKKLGSFYTHGGETKIGIQYNKLGYKFVSLLEGYCKHIGWTRHLEDVDVIENRDHYYKLAN